MVKEQLHGLMELYLKETGKWGKQLGMARCIFMMEILMLASLSRIICMVEVFSKIILAHNMMVNGCMMFKKVMVLKTGQMEISMKDFSKEDLDTDSEYRKSKIN